MIGLGGDTFKQRHLEAKLLASDKTGRDPSWRRWILRLRDAGYSSGAISREAARELGVNLDQKTVLRWIKQAEQEREQQTRKPPQKGDLVRLKLK